MLYIYNHITAKYIQNLFMKKTGDHYSDYRVEKTNISGERGTTSYTIHHPGIGTKSMPIEFDYELLDLVKKYIYKQAKLDDATNKQDK